MTPRAPPPPTSSSRCHHHHHHHHLAAADAVASHLASWNPFLTNSKKPCLSDRSTSPRITATTPSSPSASAAASLSKLSLLDSEAAAGCGGGGGGGSCGFRWQLGPRKRRRRCCSRSVSGRSSDRSATHRLSLGTCSDFPTAGAGAGAGGAATDSSGEMFDASWGSDVGEARILRREGKDIVGGGGGAEMGFGAMQWMAVGNGGGMGMAAVAEAQGNESGYGSEPGYRGDIELGYDDELDEEDDDGKQLFWGEQIGDINQMGIVGENNFGEQKTHHRCRRKKHDWRIPAPLR